MDRAESRYLLRKDKVETSIKKSTRCADKYLLLPNIPPKFNYFIPRNYFIGAASHVLSFMLNQGIISY